MLLNILYWVCLTVAWFLLEDYGSFHFEDKYKQCHSNNEINNEQCRVDTLYSHSHKNAVYRLVEM